MNKKQLKRLAELKLLEDKHQHRSALSHAEFLELQELKYLQQKQYINFRLPKDSSNGNKYYFANLTKSFSDIIKKNGHKFYNEEQHQRMIDEGIYFHSDSDCAFITIGKSRYGTNLKSFRDSQALLSYLEGYVDADWHNSKSFNKDKPFSHLVGHGQLKGKAW